jgi:sec-independent protein translocase protein TatA
MLSGLEGHWWIILVILAIVLIVWGPGRMPDVGAGMGRAIREFRNAMSGVRDSVVDAVPPPPPTHPPAPPPAAPMPSAPPPATVPDDSRPR